MPFFCNAIKYYSRILWHASVAKRNVIGCGIYQDKSYTISRGSITWREFAVILARKLLAFLVKTACIFNSLNSWRPVSTAFPNIVPSGFSRLCISGLFRLYLAKIFPLKTRPWWIYIVLSVMIPIFCLETISVRFI